MLKKVMIVLTGVICIANVSVADNYKPIRLEKLPDRARSFLNTHFPGVNVALSRKEVDFLEVPSPSIGNEIKRTHTPFTPYLCFGEHKSRNAYGA